MSEKRKDGELDKRCTKCGEVKAREAFIRRRSCGDGLHPWCRQCKQEYKEAHKEAIAARDKAWRAANKETLAAKEKEWREVNRERCAAKKKAIHEKYRATNRAYLASLRPLKCKFCGYDRCFAALEFHHTDPSQKEHALDCMGQWLKRTPAYFKAKVEVNQFIILCANCHRELHASAK